MDHLIEKIRTVHDFPKKGIVFRDITPLLQDFCLFQDIVVELGHMANEREDGKEATKKVVGIESRGFILGPVVALSIEAGFVPIRKGNKLPYKVWSAECELEYGKTILDIHQDAINPGERVVIVDDVLATGGTAATAAKLVEMCGGIVDKIIFLIEIVDLNGREKLKGYNVESLIKM